MKLSICLALFVFASATRVLKADDSAKIVRVGALANKINDQDLESMKETYLDTLRSWTSYDANDNHCMMLMDAMKAKHGGRWTCIGHKVGDGTETAYDCSVRIRGTTFGNSRNYDLCKTDELNRVPPPKPTTIPSFQTDTFDAVRFNPPPFVDIL